MTTPNFMPTPEDIRSIALINPQLAYMILNGAGLFSTQYEISVTYETVTVDQVLHGQLTERLYNPTWVKEIGYTVRRPDFAEGSVFKAQSDYYTTMQPSVDVRVNITGSNRLNVPMPQGFIPLEQLPKLAQDKLWTLPEDANVEIDFQLRRTLADTEVPYEVDVVLSCLEIIQGKQYMLAYQEARKWLVERGILENNPNGVK
jgi:hypothetical protein